MKPSPASIAPATEWQLARVTSWPRLRVLSWQGKSLYAARGYTLLRTEPENAQSAWSVVGHFKPAWWRRLTSSRRLTYRLCRDGFHFLVIMPSRHMIAAAPGVILRLAPGDNEFSVVHEVARGTRPLSIAATPNGELFWGEYFQNHERDEIHIYGSKDQGATWDIVYTFPKGAVRHVHNIVYDKWDNCLWVLTGDYGAECKIMRASCDWKQVDEALSGNQQARAVAMLPRQDALYFASDTPLEINYVYRMDRSGALRRIAPIGGPSYYGCQVGDALFFSTAAEPGEVNSSRDLHLHGSLDGLSWRLLLSWRKDHWPMMLFQYGTAILPAGNNATGLLAITGVAVEEGDLQTTLWHVRPPGKSAN